MKQHALSLAIVILTACTEPRVSPAESASAATAPLPAVRLVELQPGSSLPTAAVDSMYTTSAETIGEGKELFSSFNCDGCHFAGGGGIGPPLMDAKWIYGARPENIYSTIVEGRPNGMPSYGGKISETQLWQLVAFVKSLDEKE